MGIADSVFPRPWLERLTEKPPPETFASISQTEVYTVSNDLGLGVFGEQFFRIGIRLKQTIFIQSNTKQVYFNLAGYFASMLHVSACS